MENLVLAKRAASGAEPPAPHWSVIISVVTVMKGLEPKAIKTHYTEEDVDDLLEDLRQEMVSLKEETGANKKHISELARQVTAIQNVVLDESSVQNTELKTWQPT
ncbi:hypothetical protein MYU51_021377 [Penicillium brevicompactum]